jgi:hypothetical protein
LQTFNVNTFCYATQEQALISIFHSGTSGTYYIKQIEVVPNSPTQPAGLIDVKRYFQRITAVSGGFALPYRKANLGSPDLPSQVVLVRRPDAVTFVAGSTIRSLLLFPTSLAGLSLRSGGGAFGKGSRQGTADVWTTSRETRVEGIFLREGEGFAFGSSNPSLPVFSFSFWLTVTLRNTSTNKIYHIFTQIAPEEMKESSFAILNGTGSGITLEIVDMEINDLGSPLNALPYEASYLRFISICGTDGGGTTITPTPNNLKDSVPASLDIKKNFIGDDLFPYLAPKKLGLDVLVDLGYPQTYAVPRKTGTFGTRLAYQGAVGGVGQACFCSPIMPGRFLYGGMSMTKDRSITLNPGEGLAVVQSNNSGYSEFYVEATILYEPATSQGFSVVGNSGLVKVA